MSSDSDPEDGRREVEKSPDKERDQTDEDDGKTQYQALGSGVVQRVSKRKMVDEIILERHRIAAKDRKDRKIVNLTKILNPRSEIKDSKKQEILKKE